MPACEVSHRRPAPGTRCCPSPGARAEGVERGGKEGYSQPDSNAGEIDEVLYRTSA